MSTVAVVNRVRNLRARAKSIGFTMSKQGELVTIFDSAGLPVFSGNLAHTEDGSPNASFVGHLVQTRCSAAQLRLLSSSCERS